MEIKSEKNIKKMFLNIDLYILLIELKKYQRKKLLNNVSMKSKK
jgi:hypothetical protein